MAGAMRGGAGLARLAARLAACFALCLAACDPPAVDPRFQRVDGGLADRGPRLMARYQCGSCHTIPDVPAARAGAGPPLDGFGRRSFIAGQVPNLPPHLVRWLQDPQALVPGTGMPDLGVTEADARDMAAYLLTLR